MSSTTTNNSKTELYGGAITINKLPSTFIDISQIRQIPDTQEVFINEVDNTLSYDQSLIFDILEQVPTPNYSEAIQEHLIDIAPTGTINHLIEEFKGEDIEKFFSYIIFKPEYKRVEENQSKLNIVLICLIRINKIKTDILIQYIIPLKKSYDITLINFKSPKNEIDQLIIDNFEKFKEICLSFKIEDWNLFAS
ncbi:uncharacterized protein KGF55_002825 [Candida pseudojiufengensis]|uniref:uncharacterized protein n=1 Tax=Candida pseudojiufengensis TaxID=497109 RepID=UPI0022255487|nr:uncharacterized protein KGF55_002825 [Candida pseudojiufengensis]KAI5963033.1 hypothetical protein KGF55_002825 [Candida pseudojiufengensis]